MIASLVKTKTMVNRIQVFHVIYFSSINHLSNLMASNVLVKIYEFKRILLFLFNVYHC